ncbi:MAG: DUF222 domain-containing protein [Pseudonocardiaceae bacterium]
MLAPLLSETAAALAAGQIGPAQVKVITETMDAIPAAGGGTEDRDAAETELARHAWSFYSTSLHRIGQHILAHLDPDGPEPRDEPARPGRRRTAVAEPSPPRDRRSAAARTPQLPQRLRRRGRQDRPSAVPVLPRPPLLTGRPITRISRRVTAAVARSVRW